MKIQLTKEEKIELLKAIQSGVLNTLRIPRVCDLIQDSNAYTDLMMLCDETDDEDEEVEDSIKKGMDTPQ